MKKVGVAGIGAIGAAVCKALNEGIAGYTLAAISDIEDKPEWGVPNISFEEMARKCDLIIECLPPQIVPKLCAPALREGKELIIISSCALLMFPEILEQHALSTSRIIVPSGALIGLDGVNALKQMGIKSAKIVSTKPPMSFSTAPHVDKNGIDLAAITAKTLLFSGNALEAANGFPANVNVAATLSFAGIGATNTIVEIWANYKRSSIPMRSLSRANLAGSVPKCKIVPTPPIRRPVCWPRRASLQHCVGSRKNL